MWTGVLNNSGTGPAGARSSTPSLRIGSIQTGIAGGFFNGALDQVQLYGYVLSAAEISSLYSRAATQIGQIHGRVVNVQFTDGSPAHPGSAGPSLNGNAWSSSISPLSYIGTTWTQLSGFSTLTRTNLPYSDGTSSTIGFTLAATSGSGLFTSTNGTSPLTMFTEEVNGLSGQPNPHDQRPPERPAL